MRTKNLEYIQTEQARLQNVNLLQHSDESLQMLREDVRDRLVHIIEEWSLKVHDMRFEWESTFGRNTDKDARGKSIFAAEIERLALSGSPSDD